MNMIFSLSLIVVVLVVLIIEGQFSVRMANGESEIGNPDEMTLLEFASRINKAVGNPAGITFVPEARSERDPQRRQPDITHARETLKWEPRITLEDGLPRTIPYFKEQLGIP